MINERIVIEEKTKDYNEAWIETYFWQESEELYPGQKRPVIVICPGGAYCMTSDREAEAIAVRFMGMGYHAVVLRYSVAPARYPVALRQLAKTVALLRENSDKWHIEKNKIIVSGFSAGGHLAASLGVFWNTEAPASLPHIPCFLYLSHSALGSPTVDTRRFMFVFLTFCLNICCNNFINSILYVFSHRNFLFSPSLVKIHQKVGEDQKNFHPFV